MFIETLTLAGIFFDESQDPSQNTVKLLILGFATALFAHTIWSHK